MLIASNNQIANYESKIYSRAIDAITQLPQCSSDQTITYSEDTYGLLSVELLHILDHDLL